VGLEQAAMARISIALPNTMNLGLCVTGHSDFINSGCTAYHGTEMVPVRVPVKFGLLIDVPSFRFLFVTLHSEDHDGTLCDYHDE
jgi:hypothetical protein